MASSTDRTLSPKDFVTLAVHTHPAFCSIVRRVRLDAIVTSRANRLVSKHNATGLVTEATQKKMIDSHVASLQPVTT